MSHNPQHRAESQVQSDTRIKDVDTCFLIRTSSGALLTDILMTNKTVCGLRHSDAIPAHTTRQGELVEPAHNASIRCHTLVMGSDTGT